MTAAATRAGQTRRLGPLAWALGAGVVALVFATAAIRFLNSSGSTEVHVLGAAEGMALAGLLLATAVALLRHRLYDIDLIINQTLVYGVLTLSTVATYAVLVVSLSWAARTVVGQGSNEIAVAATTLIVAAIFQPARRRIQSSVDQPFYRAHYDAQRTVEAFQSRLRHQTDIESLRGELGATVQVALPPRSISVWLRPEGHGRNGFGSAGAYRNGPMESHR